MRKKRKDTDYLFLSSRIRCMENHLLTAQRCEQLLSLPTVPECARFLAELGYDPIFDELSLHKALQKSEEETMTDIGRFMPEPELLEVFRLKYDYHNLKTIIKSRGVGDLSHMLLDAGNMPLQELTERYAERGNWDFLPGSRATAAAEAQRVLAETGNPQRCDFILDAAYFDRLHQIARNSQCGYLENYVRILIDSANLRSLVRSWRLGKDTGFLKQVLFEGGSVSVSSVLSGAANGVSFVYRGSPLAYAAELGEESVKGGSLTAFERECDNAVARVVAQSKDVPFGVEVVLGFLTAKEAEWIAIRTIVLGRMAGMDTEAIRERVRMSYV